MTHIRNNSRFQRNVVRYVKVPTEFGSHVMHDITYNSITVAADRSLTRNILRTLHNYNLAQQNVDYGNGDRMRQFRFRAKTTAEDGDYIAETINAPDYGNRWAPDSGTSSNAFVVAANAHTEPYSSYKVYIYRSDDINDENIENPMTAREKIEEDIANGNRTNAVVGTNNQPIVFEVGRHTRTNNFSYYRKGGPMPPNGFLEQPDYYELTYIGVRFRIVLPEEDHAANFNQIDPNGNSSTVLKVAPVVRAVNNRERDGISLDMYTSSCDVEGCLAIIGVLKNGLYTNLGNNQGWPAFNSALVAEIAELEDVFGRGTDTNIDTRTRVFVKVNPLPHIATVL